MSHVTVEEARVLLDAATPGPWRPRGHRPLEITGDGGFYALAMIGVASTDDDARLMAAAPDLAATVIAQAEELAARNATIDRLGADLSTAAGEVVQLRAMLPPVAVVVCPACGTFITADLDDDARYITRRHSRRAPKTVGLGDIVWCDGGIAREVPHG